MATELLYLNDFDVLTCPARVLSANTDEDGRSLVVLDRTCFYPRGGGQDWDQGILRGSAGDFPVDEVRLDDDGVVHHLGNGPVTVVVGEEVSAEVEPARRSINTRLHSAGHVVDLAVERLGLPWVPGKGAHYPHMSFVEYDAAVNPEEVEAIQTEIQRTANDVIAAGSSNEIRFMPVSEMGTYCRNVPGNIPTNKPARIVLYSADFGVPCGGTHVVDVRDIGPLTISKIKSKKGLTKVSYALEGIS